MLENYKIAIPYTKAFLDTTKVGGFIVPCFASIHFTYKTDHEWKNY